MAAREDLVSPMLLATELGIRPQQIYKWIRDKKLAEHDVLGKKAVSRGDVEALMKSPRQKTGPKTDTEQVQRTGVKEGSLLTWEIKIRAARVTEVTEDLITAEDTSESGESVFLPKNIPSLLADGKVKIENPLRLIYMAAAQLALEGDPIGQEFLGLIGDDKIQSMQEMSRRPSFVRR